MEHVNGGGPQGDVEIFEDAYRGVPLAHNEDVHGHNDGGGIYEERTAQFPRVSWCQLWTPMYEIKEQIIKPLKDEPEESVEVGANIEIATVSLLDSPPLELLQTSITGIYFLFLPLLIIYSIFL